MKRISIVLLLCLCGLGSIHAQSLKGKTVYASINEGKLKSSTWFFAGSTGTYKYGDSFKVLEEKGTWIRVQGISNSLTGWTPASNVTTKKIVATGTGVSASAEEMALAGKGFTEEVEKSYKDEEHLDYTAIDLMETFVVKDEDILKFMQDGRLSTGDTE